MSAFTESVVEEAALEWFEALGYTITAGPSIVPGEPDEERRSYTDVVLEGRLRETLARLNPSVSREGLDEAFRKLTRISSPSPVDANHDLRHYLVNGFGRTWDGAPVPNVTVKNLSAEAFKRFKAYARDSDSMPPGSLSASRAELIERLRLTETGMLKRAALLLFHEDPEHWVTGAWVKIGMFRGGADLAFHDKVYGDLFTQMDKTLELLHTKYMVAWISYRGVARRETFPVPRDALREALLNALIHKDYSAGNPIQMRVETDSLLIFNSGPLPPSWTAQTLLERHTSQPPNPDIAGTFFRTGLIEAWGRGYERIAEACREQGTPEPTVESDGNGVWVKWAWVNPRTDAEAIRPVTPPSRPAVGSARLRAPWRYGAARSARPARQDSFERALHQPGARRRLRGDDHSRQAEQSPTEVSAHGRRQGAPRSECVRSDQVTTGAPHYAQRSRPLQVPKGRREGRRARA